MNDLSIAPYYSGYFFDEGGVVPEPPTQLYEKIATKGTDQILNSEEFVIGTTMRDGTAQFYGSIPMLPNTNGTVEEIFNQGLQFLWGDKVWLLSILSFFSFRPNSLRFTNFQFPIVAQAGRVGAMYPLSASSLNLNCSSWMHSVR